MQAIVDAVPMVMQCPAERDMQRLGLDEVLDASSRPP